ncbi:hypothetical protein [Sphingomonas alpina]|uniref:Uncharacterized protein n=1 Tax=Sphingomonas alpina TaxID=653931 RepID=A0A7H0LHW6_9SPHN|nr:hypothetical protein [Sphingomonas alpina]QNQ09269.1 hypothetical protein H3Z74_21785 [Sphingomonas alpina]
MRFETLKQIDDAGHDLRLWCFKCARGSTLDAIIWVHFTERGWALDLESARARFPCRQCKSVDHVALFPARRAAAPAEKSWAHQVERAFHDARKRKKMRRLRYD